MRSLTLCAIAIAALSAVAETPSKANVEVELKRMTNELLDAIAPGNVAVWQKYAHERLVYVTEANQVLTKTQLLEELKPLPKGLIGNLEVGTFKMELHGDVAIATHVDDERLDYHGQVLESQFRSTDTWLKTEAGWRLIGVQVLAVLVDPLAISLPRETLCSYNGTYRLTAEIVTKIACTDGGLTSERTGRKAVIQKAEVLDVFFEPGQPRTRRIFLRDAKGEITGFADRREGHDIVWKKVP